jgi:hypothetical protein
VDHAIKTGDSLLGLTSLGQLYALHLDPDLGRQLNTDLFVDLSSAIKPTVDAALEDRRQLEALPATTVRNIERKSELNRKASAGLSEAHTLANLVVGAALAARGKLSKYDDHLNVSKETISRALHASGPEREILFDQLDEIAQTLLDKDAPVGAPQRRPLHWPLAFPEVFEQGGFSAFVGNPPYIGNKYWKSRLGADFQPYWEILLKRKLGKPDLIAVFVKRLVDLLRHQGFAGVLATQSISEVDSRQLMQATVLSESAIIRAVSSRIWPGAAAVVVAQLWLTKDSDYGGQRVLDGERVDFIGAGLGDADQAAPHPLANGLRAFQGVDNSRGMSFVVAADWLESQGEGHEVLWRPYVSGEDLSENPVGTVDRFVLDLTGYTEPSLSALPDFERCYLEQTVKPTRQPEDLRSYKGLSDRWWTFWNTRESDYTRLRKVEHCLVMPAISKHLIALELPTSWCFTNKVIVFHATREDLQPLVLSFAFDNWYSRWGGTYGASARTMKIGTVVDTFPVPDQDVDPALGRKWQSLIARFPSPNSALNALHSDDNGDDLADDLREVQCLIDEAVADAYNWRDLDLTRGMHDTQQGRRWTVGKEVQREVQERLLGVNHMRHTEQTASASGRRVGMKGQTSTKRLVNSDQLTLETP